MPASFLKKFPATDRWLWATPPLMASFVIFDQWFQWSTKEDYTFGYLVPFFSAYVVYERLPAIAAYFEKPAGPGRRTPGFLNLLFSAGALLSLLCFMLGGFMRAVGGPNIIGTFLNTFGFCGATAGALWFLSEKNLAGESPPVAERLRWLALFTFPVLVWIVSGPFLYLVDSQVKFVLLDRVTGVVAQLMQSLDYPVTRQANLIILPGGDHVGVADACSGIRSLTACVFMGSFIAAIFITGPVRKTMMVAISAALAIFLNVIRTMFLTLWAYKHGSRALDFDFGGHGPKDPGFTLGTVHDIAGWGAMGVTFLILAALVPVIDFRMKTRPQSAAPSDPQA